MEVVQVKVVRAPDITDVDEKTNEFLREIPSDKVRKVTLQVIQDGKAYVTMIEYAELL